MQWIGKTGHDAAYARSAVSKAEALGIWEEDPWTVGSQGSGRVMKGLTSCGVARAYVNMRNAS
jgi:hypothetical protein